MNQEISVPCDIRADFAMICKGDGMINARIYDGDIVYIQQQDIENGDIAAVLLNGEAILCRVWIFEDHISLEPANPLYRTTVLWDEEMSNAYILGKAVAFTATIQS